MKKRRLLYTLAGLLSLGCADQPKQKIVAPDAIKLGNVSLVVLGTTQDAGSPQIACKKDCCALLFENPDPKRKVVSLGLVDSRNNKTYLFEATPDIAEQLKILNKMAPGETTEIPGAIFLTHAHIGHYTGLMYLGKEATNAQNIPVYAMPRMKAFLEQNGPWCQLVSDKNIVLEALENWKALTLGQGLEVVPFIVPHRDEYSETVGFLINGPNKTALFIPDIDKWEKWDRNIIETISKVDYAFLDATFYSAMEINNRDISEIPHPLVIESMERFKDLSATERKKIHFLHFNHTNPLLDPESAQFKAVMANGFNMASIKGSYDL